MKQDNTISIPGYLSCVEYGGNYKLPYISQYNFYTFSGVKEINFYNESGNQVDYDSDALIVVWRVKSIR